MQLRINRSANGYSLTELLVVVAIVGLISLVTIPAFINFSHQNSLNGAMRNFSTDIRSARQRAITRSSQVLLEVDSASSYSFWESINNGGTFNQVSLGGSNGLNKSLDPTVSFLLTPQGMNWLNDTNGQPAILFKPDGTAYQGDGTPPSGPMQITMQSSWTGISVTQYAITVSTTGRILHTP